MTRKYYSVIAALVLGVSAAFCSASMAGEPVQDVKTVTIEKELADGSKIVFKKHGQEAAYATLTIDGKEVEIDSFEPITRFPEETREVVTEVWNEMGEIPKKTINVEIDCSESPESQEWAERAKSRVLYWYPKVVALLDGEEAVDRIPDDFTIKLSFKDMDGVAYAMGRSITVSSRYIKRNPKDFGLVVHETTHVAQAYPNCREVWAMEGETDYIRYYITEARTKNHWGVDPNRSKYTDSYGVTAAWYDWMIKNVDDQLIQKIHRVFRIQGSIERFFVEEYGKSCQELWDEFISSTTK